MSKTILVISDSTSLVSQRYPATVDGQGTRLTVTAGTVADLQLRGIVAAVVDTENASDVDAALATRLPTLLSADSIVALCRWDAARLCDVGALPHWLPYLPTSLMSDVLYAARLVSDGVLGGLWCIDIVTYVGQAPTAVLPDGDTIEEDAPLARSPLEAVVFGLDIVEQLTSTSKAVLDDASHAARNDVRPGMAWRIGDVRVTHHVLPAALAPVPLFSATISGEYGAVYLRQPFAPGVVARWDTKFPGFRCPVVSRRKSNIQAPDSARGGHEATMLLTALLNGETSESASARSRFLHLLAASLDALPRHNRPPQRRDRDH